MNSFGQGVTLPSPPVYPGLASPRELRDLGWLTEIQGPQFIATQAQTALPKPLAWLVGQIPSGLRGKAQINSQKRQRLTACCATGALIFCN